MGCENSNLGLEGSSETMHSKLGLLLGGSLENIKRRRRVADAMTLKESTLSTKELVKDAAAPDSSEGTSSRISTSKPEWQDADAKNSLYSSPARQRVQASEGKRNRWRGRKEEA